MIAIFGQNQILFILILNYEHGLQNLWQEGLKNDLYLAIHFEGMDWAYGWTKVIRHSFVKAIQKLKK